MRLKRNYLVNRDNISNFNFRPHKYSIVEGSHGRTYPVLRYSSAMILEDVETTKSIIVPAGTYFHPCLKTVCLDVYGGTLA